MDVTIDGEVLYSLVVGLVYLWRLVRVGDAGMVEGFLTLLCVKQKNQLRGLVVHFLDSPWILDSPMDYG